MARYNVLVRLTGYVDIEVEADSYSEACEEACLIADDAMVDGWDVDVEDCEREDD